MEREIPKCEKCGKEMVKDLDSRVFRNYFYGESEWDGHTYKWNCNCVDKNLRLSIG